MNYFILLSRFDAKMLSLGVKNVLRLDEKLIPPNGRCYFITTDEQGIDENTPLEWLQEELNQRDFGNLSELDHETCYYLWGYFDCITSVSRNMNVWSAGLPDSAFLVDNVHLFDLPPKETLEELRNVRDLDERPSHVLRPRFPFLRDAGREFVLPVSNRYYEIACCGGFFSIEVTGRIATLIRDRMDDIDVLTVVNGIKTKRFCFQAEIMMEGEEEPDGPYMYPSVLSPSGKAPREMLVLTFAFPSLD